jgi:hypothetical protein
MVKAADRAEHGGRALVGRDNGIRVWVALAAFAAALVIALAVYGGVRALTVLGAMQSDVQRMSVRMDALDQMNRKLDGLATMSRHVSSLNGQLQTMIGQIESMNRQLGLTNGKLAGVDGDMRGMSGTLQTMAQRLAAIDAMRADIHQLVHKVNGSFLFRGVK